MVTRQATYQYTLGLRIYNEQTEDFRILPIQFGDDRVLTPAQIQERATEIFEIAKETDDQTKSEDFDGYISLQYQDLRISPEPPLPFGDGFRGPTARQARPSQPRGPDGRFIRTTRRMSATDAQIRRTATNVRAVRNTGVESEVIRRLNRRGLGARRQRVFQLLRDN